jgi:NAD(P)-dependent dehydrogenase (short-subunit alcohol dehydrogenase family)
VTGFLHGRRAFVTGSSSGIGAESARALAAAGAALVLHGRDAGKLAAVEKELRSVGADVATVMGPLDEPESAREIAAQAIAVGPIDILVNNAGGAASQQGATDWFGASPEEWLASYQANVVSMVSVTQTIAPGMIERGWGRIIQIASAIVDNPISPGFIASEGLRAWVESQAATKGWGDTWEEIERNAAGEVYPALVPRLGRPYDIARTVVFLADPAADFVTGAHLRIDGGLPIA